jgi:hypothetical protein
VIFIRRATGTRSRYFEIFRLAFDKDGNRIRLTITVYPCDRNRLRVDVGEVPPRGTPGADSTSESDE